MVLWCIIGQKVHCLAGSSSSLSLLSSSDWAPLSAALSALLVMLLIGDCFCGGNGWIISFFLVPPLVFTSADRFIQFSFPGSIDIPGWTCEIFCAGTQMHRVFKALVRVGFATGVGVGLLDWGRTNVTWGIGAKDLVGLAAEWETIWGSVAVEDEVAVVFIALACSLLSALACALPSNSFGSALPFGLKLRSINRNSAHACATLYQAVESFLFVIHVWTVHHKCHQQSRILVFYTTLAILISAMSLSTWTNLGFTPYLSFRHFAHAVSTFVCLPRSIVVAVDRRQYDKGNPALSCSAMTL